jgi:hypothetical protein
MPDSTTDVVISENYAYVTVSREGLQIIDINNPANLTFKGTYDTPNIARKVAVSENYAYVADANSGLQIIDVKDPSNPTFKGSFDPIGVTRGVAVSGNYAYVAFGTNGLQIIDVNDPSNPIFKGSYDTNAIDIVLYKNYTYIAGSGLQIIDATNLTNPMFISSYDTYWGAFGVTVSENYAYIGSNHLRIIDISDPFNPTSKGSYGTMHEEISDITVLGNYAYVLGFEIGLRIVDIRDPLNPTFKSSYDIPNVPNIAYGIALSGNYVYVAHYSGLHIIASNLDKLFLSGTPSIIGTYDVNIKGYNEKKEYMIGSFNIHVINNSPIISNPLQNQTAIVNTLFSYTFPNTTFNDPDKHPLTYTAELSDNSPLPNWINFNRRFRCL